MVLPPPLNGKSLCPKKLGGKGGGVPPPLNGKNPLSSFWQRPLCNRKFIEGWSFWQKHSTTGLVLPLANIFRISLFEKFFNHRRSLLQLFPHWPLRAADITIQSKVCGNFEKRWHSANISSRAPQNKLHQKCHQVNFGMWTAPTRKLWRKLNCVVVSLYRSIIQMKACTTDKLDRWCSSEKQGTNTLRGAI